MSFLLFRWATMSHARPLIGSTFSPRNYDECFWNYAHRTGPLTGVVYVTIRQTMGRNGERWRQKYIVYITRFCKWWWFFGGGGLFFLLLTTNDFGGIASAAEDNAPGICWPRSKKVLGEICTWKWKYRPRAGIIFGSLSLIKMQITSNIRFSMLTTTTSRAMQIT